MAEILETYRGAVYPWHMDRGARKACPIPDGIVEAGRRLLDSGA